MGLISRDLRINEQIRVREVRLIGQEGEQLGIVAVRDALRMAADAGVDLVEVASTARPPVCRLMDYGRFKYEQSKRERDARKKQRTGGELKEVKMRPNIDDHDFGFKSRNALKFLKEGNKVKVTVMFRGREIVHQDLARGLMERFFGVVSEVGAVERPPKTEGRNMVMILTPKAEVKAEARAAARAGGGARPEEAESEVRPAGSAVPVVATAPEAAEADE